MRTVFTTLFSVLVLAQIPSSRASVECSNDGECESILRAGAVCLDSGFCSNPYVHGCLANRLTNWTKLRVCNSQDPPSVIEQGLCRPSPLNYTEVRIQSQSWETGLFVTWVMQVLLSELLDVPTSIETSWHEKQVNFYNYESKLSYGFSNDVEALERAADAKDCVPLTKSLEGYLSCSHVISEVWGAHRWTPDLVKRDIIEPAQPMGELGQEGWYIPLYTVKHDPSLVTWTGLVGDANREKLAETFKKPFSWGQYCELISADNCATPDETAVRAPKTEHEEWLFFVEGFYTGFFNATEINDCTANPQCKGHMVDFPCGWSSYVEPTLYHLDIALESTKYWYEAMKEIWRAANATKNHVIMLYANPDGLVPEFIDSDFAFQRVSLPPPTQECVKARRADQLRCAVNTTESERLGDPAGTCDEPIESLQKVISTALLEITNGPNIPEALRSPAYHAIKEFTISNLRMTDMFSYWHKRSTDKWEFGTRDGVCEWLVDNLEYLESFVPPSFPRVIHSHDRLFTDQWNTVSILALCLALVALVLVVVFGGVTYVQRKKPAMQRAQVFFLALLLAGLLLVAVGSVEGAFSPRDGTCIATAWLINFGYSIELVPLVVKSAALNRIMGAGRRMKRTILKQEELYRTVAYLSTLVLVILVVWTVVDPPLRKTEYTLTGATNKMGETLLETEYHCASDSPSWRILSISWQLFLLMIAGVLAFQNRKFRNDLTEVRTLALMIYSHVVFVGLRGVTYLLQGSISAGQLYPYHSLTYSADVLATLLIYFLPKFFDDASSGPSIFISSGSLQLDMSDLGSSQALKTPKSLRNLAIKEEEASESGDQAVEEAKSRSATEDLTDDCPSRDPKYYDLGHSEGGEDPETRPSTE